MWTSADPDLYPSSHISPVLLSQDHLYHHQSEAELQILSGHIEHQQTSQNTEDMKQYHNSDNIL